MGTALILHQPISDAETRLSVEVSNPDVFDAMPAPPIIILDPATVAIDRVFQKQADRRPRIDTKVDHHGLNPFLVAYV
jgi:hypothetical protein